MKKGHSAGPISIPKNFHGDGKADVLPPELVLEIRGDFALLGAVQGSLGGGLGGLLPGGEADLIVSLVDRPKGKPATLVGFFPKRPNAKALLARRKAILDGYDLIPPDPEIYRNTPSFALLLPKATLQALANAAGQAAPHDPHFQLLDVAVSLEKPATVTVTLDLYVQDVPGVPIVPPATEYTAHPQIIVHLSASGGRVTADGRVELRTPQLVVANGVAGGPAEKGLNQALDGIKTQLASVPTQILIPDVSDKKLLIQSEAVACDPRDAEGPDGDGTVPAGVLVTGYLDLVPRKPAVFIAGPTQIRTEIGTGAHGYYRAITRDLRPPLTVAWSSDGTVTTPKDQATTVGWSTLQVEPHHAHHVAVTVTDADGVVAKAKTGVEVLVHAPGKVTRRETGRPAATGLRSRLNGPPRG